jgi:magnesium chelatase family protein
VSGPLLDRIDLRVTMPRMGAVGLVSGDRPESSAVVAARIRAAACRALDRNGGQPNAMLQGQRLMRAAGMSRSTTTILTELAGHLELTARGVHRMMRVARTIADLRGLDTVGDDEVYAATALRDRSMEVDAAA